MIQIYVCLICAAFVEGYIIFALSDHFVEGDEEHEDGGPRIFQNLSYLCCAPPTHVFNANLYIIFLFTD